jgi:acetoin utilization protein AcuB
MSNAPSKTTVEHFMTRHPHSIRAGESLATAEELMARFDCHHLPVLEGGQLVGILSDRDIRLVKKADHGVDLKKVTVESACVEDPHQVDIDTSVTTAAEVMAEKRIHSLLVMEQGKLAGIFTATDACRALAGFFPAA